MPKALLTVFEVPSRSENGLTGEISARQFGMSDLIDEIGLSILHGKNAEIASVTARCS